MKGLENNTYLVMLVAFNIVAIFFLIAAVRWPKLSRFLYFLLFGWACWMNWTTSQRSPAAYLEYAELSFIPWYRDFIQGWFSSHIPVLVGVIATCQGLIAISMLLKGTIFKTGCTGGIVFLLSIVPLGVGSGFPCTITFAAGLWVLYRKQTGYLWTRTSTDQAW